MANSPIYNDIHTLVTNSINDAVAKSTTITSLDTTDIVSLGQVAESNDKFVEDFFGALVNRIVRTVYFVRVYKGNTRNILKDEHEFGAFVQKVYIDTPDAVENPQYLKPSNGKVTRKDARDVDTIATVTSLLYGGQGTFSFEIAYKNKRIRSAFTNRQEEMTLVDYIQTVVTNKYNLALERLTATAVNTGIAYTLTNGTTINLLSEYNKLVTVKLTAANCMYDKEFLRYAITRITTISKNMQTMSRAFNALSYDTFTTPDYLTCEILSPFMTMVKNYLVASSYQDLEKLPKYNEIPFWQFSGDDFSLNNISKIKISHDDFISAKNTTGEVEEYGVICHLRDSEFVAAYFGDYDTWSENSKRDGVTSFGYNASKGYAVDGHANSVVFTIKDTATSS